VNLVVQLTVAWFVVRCIRVVCPMMRRIVGLFTFHKPTLNSIVIRKTPQCASFTQLRCR